MSQPPTSEPGHRQIWAGWYPDPSGALRYWDGTQWTEHTMQVPAPSPGVRLRVAAAFAQLALFATLLADAVLIKLVWDRLSLVDRAVANPQTVSLLDIRHADSQVHGAAVFLLVTYLLAGIAFIVWFYRARISAEQHNPDVLRFGRGWAIGSWITPILGLWRPYQMTTDVLCASELPANARDFDRHPYNLLRIWWFLFVVSAISFRVSNVGSSRSVKTFDTHSKLLIGSTALDLLAGVFALAVVERITAANDRRRAETIAASATS